MSSTSLLGSSNSRSFSSYLAPSTATKSDHFAPTLMESQLEPSHAANSSYSTSRTLSTPSPPPGSEIYLTPPHSPPTPHHLYQNASSDVNSSPRITSTQTNNFNGSSRGNNSSRFTTTKYNNGVNHNQNSIINSGLGKLVSSVSQPLNSNSLTPVPRPLYPTNIEPERINEKLSLTTVPSKSASAQTSSKASHSLSTQSFLNPYLSNQPYQNSMTGTRNNQNSLYSPSSLTNRNSLYSSVQNQNDLFSSCNNSAPSTSQYQHIIDIPYPR